MDSSDSEIERDGIDLGAHIGRVALITGASRGIGAAVAKAYASVGMDVILVARNAELLERVDDEIKSMRGKGSNVGKATLVPLDLREHDKIDALGANIYERFGRLDVLVGNAAILGQITPMAHADPRMWQMVMDINLTANYRLIRSMNPLLTASEAGRAIFVTSGAARAAFPYWGAYAASKAALEMVVRTYAQENKKTKILANLVDPGVVATDMRKQAFPGEDQSSLAKPEDITDIFLRLASPAFKHSGQVFLA